MTLPLLYSLQHCPYAMRARMGILMAQQQVRLRAIKTKNKPPHLLEMSPKGTVPVLILENGQVIDESLDIMLWALKENDPFNLLYSHDNHALKNMLALIHLNDYEFKPALEIYKMSARKKNPDIEAHRNDCEIFIALFEEKLTQHKYLFGNEKSLVDYAILPFIRQFARVERRWYLESEYTHVQAWLNEFLQAPGSAQLFTKVMAKYDLWMDCGEEFIFNNQVKK